MPRSWRKYASRKRASRSAEGLGATSSRRIGRDADGVRGDARGARDSRHVHAVALQVDAVVAHHDAREPVGVGHGSRALRGHRDRAVRADPLLALLQHRDDRIDHVAMLGARILEVRLAARERVEQDALEPRPRGTTQVRPTQWLRRDLRLLASTPRLRNHPKSVTRDSPQSVPRGAHRVTRPGLSTGREGGWRGRRRRPCGRARGARGVRVTRPRPRAEEPAIPSRPPPPTPRDPVRRRYSRRPKRSGGAHARTPVATPAPARWPPRSGGQGCRGRGRSSPLRD